MSPYRVVIVIKNEWWSDGQTFKTVAAAQRHRRDAVAPRWNDCDTAICGADGHIMHFRDSLLEQAEFARAIA